MNSNQISFFNLNDGESAVIRILSTTVAKIERKDVHVVNIAGKKKSINCLGSKCPLCSQAGMAISERLYVHLWDYTDNSEKVWNRTTNEKFMQMLADIERDWGDLSECVIRVTRSGRDFPSYTLDILNASKYAPVDKSLINTNVAYRFSLYRSADELNQFISTGVLPEHKKSQSSGQPWLPKSEWIKQQNAKKEEAAADEARKAYEAASSKIDSSVSSSKCNNTCESCDNVADFEDDDQFIDPFIHHRRV